MIHMTQQTELSCQDMVKLIGLYALCALKGTRLRKAEQHLAKCSYCFTKLLALKIATTLNASE
jgi:hypothetical protein